MHDTLDQQTGLLKSQILDMSFGQQFNPGEKWKKVYPLVADVLSKCTERDQDIFTLIYNDNVPYRQIATIHKISHARVGQINDKIIKSIRKKFVQTYYYK